MLIKISHLKKAYGDIVPLKDVNCEINRGEIITIIGPSGTGKSTLLNCINRLDDCTSGSIICDGEEIMTKNYDKCKLRKKIGMVFQSFNLFYHLTVMENIMLAPCKLMGLSKEEARATAVNLLELVGLSDKANAYPVELSGGQSQRIAIARALAMHPKIILFDEPTSALDAATINEVLVLIKKLKERNITMLIVTHDLKFAKDVSDRVFYMDEGVIFEEGTPEQIFENPQKEKTKQFINKLKVFNYSFSKNDFDFLHLLSNISRFVFSSFIPKDLSYKMNIIAEEIIVSNLIPNLENNEIVDFSFVYSSIKNTIDLVVCYNGKKRNVLDFSDEISKRLINNFSENITYTYKDRNEIKVEIV